MGEPIRVLQMIGSLNIGGSQAMIINLYNTIDRSKIQFDFVLDHPMEIYYKDYVVSLGAKVYEMPTFTGKNYIQVKKAWNTFFYEHPEYKILHSHVRSYASIYIPIAKKHGVKTIIHSHSTSNGKGFSSIVKRIMQYPLRYQADWFFSCSEEAGKWLFGKKIVSDNRHAVMKNSIAAAAYRFSKETREEYRRTLGVDDKLVYAHVGRFHPSKNHNFLLRVFRKIRDKQTDAVLLLIGDGELRLNIEADIENLGLRNDVLLLGNRHDVPKLLQAADVFLFPSVWEGLGIVVVEAQAAGLPCICSNQIPAVVKVVENCELLPLQHELWVKSALSTTLCRVDTYEQIVEAGYDVCDNAKRLQSFYLKLQEEGEL